jgi:hypothetical protein
MKAPKLTQADLHESMKPPNHCRVKAFMETLDPDSLAVFEEALGMSVREYSANSIHELLIKAGFAPDAVPGVGAIKDHRGNRRPCRCLD